MDIIRYLNTLITPVVQIGDVHSEPMLTQFYALLVARLADPLYVGLYQASGVDSALFWQPDLAHDALAQKLAHAHHLPISKVRTLMELSAPKALIEIGKLGDIGTVCKDALPSLERYLPMWAGAFVSLPSDTVHTIDDTPTPKQNLWWALPLVGGLVGAAGFYYYQNYYQNQSQQIEIAQITQSAPTPAPELMPLPALVSFSTDATGGLYACYLRVADTASHQRANEMLNRHFGRAPCMFDVHAMYAPMDIAALEALIDTAKNYPNVSVQMQEGTVFVQHNEPAVAQELVAKLVPLAPNLRVVVGESAPIDLNALQQYAKELDAQKLARLLNLSRGAPAFVQLAGQFLANNPNVRLVLVASSERMGRADALTQSQADAGVLKEALLKAGAKAEQILTFGIGNKRPIASDESDWGRAQNRRVDVLLFAPELVASIEQIARDDSATSAPAPINRAPIENETAMVAQVPIPTMQNMPMPNMMPMPTIPNAPMPNAPMPNAPMPSAPYYNPPIITPSNNMPIANYQIVENAPPPIDDDLLRPVGTESSDSPSP